MEMEEEEGQWSVHRGRREIEEVEEQEEEEEEGQGFTGVYA